jgi:hypothetical protein
MKNLSRTLSVKIKDEEDNEKNKQEANKEENELNEPD